MAPTPDPLADLALLSRYAALGVAHSPDPTADLVAVASAGLRLRQALTAPAPTPEKDHEPQQS